MRLLRICVVIAIAAGVVAAPHVAGAQALGEAATLSAGASSAGSASGSTLGSSIGRAMGNEGRRMASSGRTSTSGGVMNLHWSREELKRSESKARTHANDKTAKKTLTGSKKAQPDFVIFGADPSNSDRDTDPDQAPATQPKAANAKGSSGKDGVRN